MGSLDPAKILVILVVALIVMGPNRLPVVARQLGSMLREVVKIREQVVDEVRSALPSDLPRIPTPPPGAIAEFVTGLAAVPPAPAKRDTQAVEPAAAEAGTGFEVSDFAFVPDDPSMN